MKIRRRRGGVYAAEHTSVASTGESRTITAAVQMLSARRINRRGKQAPTSVQSAWQLEAWEFYDRIGEFRFATNLVANAVSRCSLIAGTVEPGSGEVAPVEDGTPADLVAEWAGGPAGQRQFLKRAAQHLSVPGDSYFVGRNLPADEVEAGDMGEEWRPWSTEEARHAAGGWSINPGDGMIPLGVDDVIFRCWLPSPRRWIEAESPARGALTVLREIDGLTARIMAEIDSRLAGNGLLILPQEFEFPKGQGDINEATGEADFIETLLDYMVTPIKDRGSAAAVVPLIITAPGEMIGNAQHLKFWSELDGQSKELRENALERFARAVDIPKEVTLGLSDSNHWSAWAIDRDTVQLHIAPLLAVICFALTVGWYRPALEAAGVANAGDYVLWFDTSPLEIKADKTEAAKDAFDRFAIGPRAYRREIGFTEDDAPTPDELREMLLVRLIDRISDPRALLEALGVPTAGVPDLAPPAPVAPALPAGDGEQPAEADPAGDPDGEAVPDGAQASAAYRDAGPAAPLLYVADMAVHRALELAGKRLITRHIRASRPDLNHVPAHTLHVYISAGEGDLERILTGVWSVLADVVPDSQPLIEVLDAYVRDLIRTGTPHEPRFLARALHTATGGSRHA